MGRLTQFDIPLLCQCEFCDAIYMFRDSDGRTDRCYRCKIAHGDEQ